MKLSNSHKAGRRHTLPSCNRTRRMIVPSNEDLMLALLPRYIMQWVAASTTSEAHGIVASQKPRPFRQGEKLSSPGMEIKVKLYLIICRRGFLMESRMTPSVGTSNERKYTNNIHTCLISLFESKR